MVYDTVVLNKKMAFTKYIGKMDDNAWTSRNMVWNEDGLLRWNLWSDILDTLYTHQEVVR